MVGAVFVDGHLFVCVYFRGWAEGRISQSNGEPDASAAEAAGAIGPTAYGPKRTEIGDRHKNHKNYLLCIPRDTTAYPRDHSGRIVCHFQICSGSSRLFQSLARNCRLRCFAGPAENLSRGVISVGGGQP